MWLKKIPPYRGKKKYYYTKTLQFPATRTGNVWTLAASHSRECNLFPLLGFFTASLQGIENDNTIHKLQCCAQVITGSDDQSQWLFTTHSHSPFLLSKACEAVNRLLGHILSLGSVILVKTHAVYSLFNILPNLFTQILPCSSIHSNVLKAVVVTAFNATQQQSWY